MTNTVITILTAAAVVIQVLLALVLLLALVSLFSARGRAILADIRDSLYGAETWLAWIFAAVATGGSLFFSEYSHFIPCHLCWLQRIGMYPMSAILLVAAIRRDRRGGGAYALPLAIYGAGIAIYHVYIEHHPAAQTAGCKVGGTTCATEWFKKLGYITIPSLSLTAFLAIIVLSLFALSRSRYSPPPAAEGDLEEEPEAELA